VWHLGCIPEAMKVTIMSMPSLPTNPNDNATAPSSAASDFAPKPQTYVNGDKLPVPPGTQDCPGCGLPAGEGSAMVSEFGSMRQWHHACRDDYLTKIKRAIAANPPVPPALVEALGREMDKAEGAHKAHLDALFRTTAPTLGSHLTVEEAARMANAPPGEVHLPPEADPLAVQIGGDHYKTMAIQPMEYSMKNKLDACQHTIIKYVTRFRSKGGVQDLEKAKHCIDMLIAFEKDGAK